MKGERAAPPTQTKTLKWYPRRAYAPCSAQRGRRGPVGRSGAAGQPSPALLIEKENVVRGLHRPLLRRALIVATVLRVSEEAVGPKGLDLALQVVVLELEVLEAGHELEALGHRAGELIVVEVHELHVGKEAQVRWQRALERIV